MSERKAFLFDIDGTLIDSVDLHAQSWLEALRKHGAVLTFEECRSHIGEGADRLLPALMPNADKALREKIEEYRAQLFKDKFLARVRPFPGVAELLARVRRDGHVVVLASSCKAGEIAAYKRIVGIEDLVDQEVTADDVDASKPAPDIFAKAQERSGLRPIECLAVGDTRFDGESARRAGLAFVGLLCGGSTEAELRKAGALEVFRDPADMLASYDRLLWLAQMPIGAQ